MERPYLMGLNEAQLEAVLNTEGPNMVIAGPGSGKTRVLTTRIAHLVAEGVDPFRILALTFTNKAAKEMKSRISKLLEGSTSSDSVWAGTFHSVFARALRLNAERIGYTSDFSIYDSDDTRSLIKSVVKSMRLDEKLYKPALIQNRISQAKNAMIGPLEYAENERRTGFDEESGRPRIADIYEEYAFRCFKSNAMDFDDLLFNMALMLRDHDDIREQYQQRFSHVLVDEYQDTNAAQFDIVRQLVEKHRNITVVGDDSQSIYSFRGAKVGNMLRFLEDYPDHKLLKLEQNYRSIGAIVDAANSVITNNKDRIDKTIWTENSAGDRISIHLANSEQDEADYVARCIAAIAKGKGAKPSEFAVLYRTNAQSRSIETALSAKAIPYRVYGGISFYQRKEVKDLIAYMRLACNPNDEEALKRVINYPTRGIGNSTVDRLLAISGTRKLGIWDAMDQHLFDAGLGDSTLKKVSDFIAKIKGFQAVAKGPASDAVDHIADSSGVMSELGSDLSPEGQERHDNAQQLVSAAKEFNERRPSAPLADFLAEIALVTGSDSSDDGTVSLMTAHASKGLEFPYVFIIGLEEGLFPNSLGMSTREDLEEERRLFYVALTRAERYVSLVHSQSRFRWGQVDYPAPSRFLREVGDGVTRTQSPPRPKPATTPPWARALKDRDDSF